MAALASLASDRASAFRAFFFSLAVVFVHVK